MTTDFDAALERATADPDAEFVSRLRADVVSRAEIGAARPQPTLRTVDPMPELELASVEPAKRRRRTPVVLGACAALALLAVGIVTAQPSSDSNLTASATSVPSATTSPSNEPSTPPWIWLSSPEMSTNGGSLIAVVVNPSNEALNVSPAEGPGEFERWTGSRWEKVGTWANGTADHRGGLVFTLPLIMLAPGATGEREPVMIPPKGAGRYRLTKFGASGEFDITDNPTPDPFIDTVEPTGLTVSPQLLGGGGGILHLVKADPTVEDMELFVARANPRAKIEQWTDGEWLPVGETPLIADGISNVAGMAVVVPPQPNGTYRLVQRGPNQVVTAIYWVSDSLDVRPLIASSAQLRADRLPTDWVSLGRLPRWPLGGEPQWQAGRMLSAGSRGSANVSLITDGRFDESLRGSVVESTITVAGRPASFIRWNNGLIDAPLVLMMQDGDRPR
jgi:hypothetical protein